MVEVCLGKLSLAEGEVQALEGGGRKLLVARYEGRFHVLENRCGHLPKPMYGATLSGPCLRCPYHATGYDVRSGAILDDRGFLGLEGLTVVESFLREDQLWVRF